MQIETSTDMGLLKKMRDAMLAHIKRGHDLSKQIPKAGQIGGDDRYEDMVELVRIERRLAYLHNLQQIRSRDHWLNFAERTDDGWASVLHMYAPARALDAMLAVEQGDAEAAYGIMKDMRPAATPDLPSPQAWDLLCILCDAWHNFRKT